MLEVEVAVFERAGGDDGAVFENGDGTAGDSVVRIADADSGGVQACGNQSCRDGGAVDGERLLDRGPAVEDIIAVIDGGERVIACMEGIPGDEGNAAGQKIALSEGSAGERIDE